MNKMKADVLVKAMGPKDFQILLRKSKLFSQPSEEKGRQA